MITLTALISFQALENDQQEKFAGNSIKSGTIKNYCNCALALYGMVRNGLRLVLADLVMQNSHASQRGTVLFKNILISGIGTCSSHD